MRCHPLFYALAETTLLYTFGLSIVHLNNIAHLLGGTDVYLIDQIIKGRYHPSDVLLDAGAGGGRNLQCIGEIEELQLATIFLLY